MSRTPIQEPQSRLRRIRSWIGATLSVQTPVGRLAWLLRLYGPFPRWRTHRLITRLLGPQHRRSRSHIEIDLTYACNLACANCNRSVPQAPSSEMLTLDDITDFVAQSERRDIRWERIRLLGGEPTLHPQFFEILQLLRAYRDRSSPDTLIEVTTNGFGSRVAAALARIPADISVNNSAKDRSGAEQKSFDSFNVAPRDLPAYATADYSNGCRILGDCGIGLAPGGYYQCAIAGGIDRILSKGIGRSELPSDADEMRDQMEALCGWCGHFKRELGAPLSGQNSSRSWDEAYAEWRLRRRLPAEGARGSSRRVRANS